MLTAGIATITLVITLAGIPLLIVTAAVIRGCASAERWRLRGVLGEPVHGGYRDATGLGMLARVRACWTDPAVWRDLAYLGGLFPLLWALDLAVLTIWLTFIGCITVPAWYWAPEQTYQGGSHHGLQFGDFPHGPHGPGAVGVYVDTLPKAIVTALVFLAASLLFQYVVVYDRPAACPDRRRPARGARRPARSGEGGTRPTRPPLGPAQRQLRPSTR